VREQIHQSGRPSVISEYGVMLLLLSAGCRHVFWPSTSLELMPSCEHTDRLDNALPSDYTTLNSSGGAVKRSHHALDVSCRHIVLPYTSVLFRIC
jgi:hypothetical protein